MKRTSEFISPMHPDKLCDRISDAILDESLRQDPDSRCAIETMGGHGQVFISGEVTTRAALNLDKIVSRITKKKLKVSTNIVRQSLEIASGVDTGGAGDQGVMVGYACRENEAMIPQEHYLVRSLCQYLYQIHPDDGKTQITLNNNGEISVAIASWRGVSQAQLLQEVTDWYNKNNLRLSQDFKLICNSAGDWDLGGFDADTGLTGRKIVIDAYGTRVPVGGGAFSGKDWTKVDRSGAYRARQLALHLLQADKSNRFMESSKIQNALVHVAYAIGEPSPTQISVIFNGQQEHDITEEYSSFFVPAQIKQELKLHQPIFEETAKWGHFGNGFAWDKPFKFDHLTS